MIVRLFYLIFLALAMISCSTGTEECSFCTIKMPHASRIVVLVEGESTPRKACSITCVLNYQKTEGKRVRFLRVTDFFYGKIIDPQKAFYVVGSDVNPCLEHSHGPFLSELRTPLYLDWSRYTPSVLAFATREDAEKFQKDHGGRVDSSSILGFEN
jgi:nitrous oxide reductase accessory protein NosL